LVLLSLLNIAAVVSKVSSLNTNIRGFHRLILHKQKPHAVINRLAVEPSGSRSGRDFVFRNESTGFPPFFPLSVGWAIACVIGHSLHRRKRWAVYRVLGGVYLLTSVSGCLVCFLLGSLQVGARVGVTRSRKYGSLVLLKFEVCSGMPVNFVCLIIVSALCAHVCQLCNAY